MNFINRELSWLEFNQRVLDEGSRPDKPLLERLKFLAITASNLDEFFQVRVGGLAMMRRAGSRVTDSAGLTPAQQMTAIRKRVLQMTADQFKLLNEDLLPSMAKEGIVLVDTKQLTPSQHLQAAAYFSDFAFPLLTPLAVDPDGPRPDLPSLQIIIACRLEQEDGTTRIAFVPIGDSLPRFVPISAQEGDAFIYIEDLVRTLVGELFPGETVVGTAPFRITRNSDIAVQEEDVIDLAGEMEEVLATRRLSDTIRIQISSSTPRDLLNVIQEVTGTGANELYRLPGPLALTDFMKLCFLPGYELLCDEAWLPQPSPLIDPGTSMLDTIAERDIFLIHPFESFEPVVRLLEEAAVDPNVLAIKQVLYRTASDSRIIRALTRAAQNGKQVTVLVELKARFDEQRNLMMTFGGVGTVFSDETWEYTGVSTAQFGAFGQGCPHSQGISVITGTPPVLGSQFDMTVQNVPTGVFATIVAHGFSSEISNLGPLPFGLTPFGLPGCFLEVEDAAVLAVLPNASSEFVFGFAVPNDTALINLNYYVQAFVPDVIAPTGLGGLSRPSRGVFGN